MKILNYPIINLNNTRNIQNYNNQPIYHFPNGQLLFDAFVTKTTQPSFKGFFDLFKKKVYVSKEQAEKELKQMGYTLFQRSLNPVSDSNGQVAKEFLEIAKSMAKSMPYTCKTGNKKFKCVDLITGCYSRNGVLNKDALNYTRQLIESNFTYDDIRYINHMASSENWYDLKYNNLIPQCVLKDIGKYKRKNLIDLINAAGGQMYFKQKRWDIIVNNMKKLHSDANISVIGQSCSSDQRFDLFVDMVNAGISTECINHIFDLIRYNLEDDDRRVLKTLLTDIPDNLRNDDKGNYIFKRLDTCLVSDKLDFYQDKYNKFNEIYRRTQDLEKATLVKECYSVFDSHCLDGSYSLLLENAQKLSLTTLRQILQAIENKDATMKLKEIVSILKDKHKEQLKYYNSYYTLKPQFFKELYLNSDGNIHIKDIFKLSGICKNKEQLELAKKYYRNEFVADALQIGVSDEKTFVACLNLLKEDFPMAALKTIYKKFNVFDEKHPVFERINNLVSQKMNYRDAVNFACEYMDSAGCISKENEKEFNLVLNIRNKAIDRRNTLQIADENLSITDIDRLIIPLSRVIAFFADLLGEDTLDEVLKHDIYDVEDTLINISSLMNKNLEDLRRVINPKTSDLYENLQADIAGLKKEFKTVLTDTERQKLIKEINTKTRQLRDMSDLSIKDPQQKLDLALIYSVLDTDAEKAKIIPYLSQKNEEQKIMFKKVLSQLLFESLSVDYNKLPKDIDFTESKYFYKFFMADEDFDESFRNLLNTLSLKLPDETMKKFFDGLENNEKTRKIFHRNGINYNKWVSPSDTSIKINVRTDVDFQRKKVIEHFEEDFNSNLFSSLPKEEQDSLLDSLKQHGFELKPLDNSGKSKRVLYRNDCRVDFDDLNDLLAIIKTFINWSGFWNSQFEDETIDSLKNEFKYHILNMRYNEIRKLKSKDAGIDKQIVVSKVDMNDIMHSLFLGNHAGCCTAIGSRSNDWSAPNYVKNKFISAIEVKDGDKPVGNTMCYFALVDSQIALILDNIELLPTYQYDDKIRDAIIACAKKICREVGKSKIPVYASPQGHKVNMNEYVCRPCRVQILGYSGNDDVYIDWRKSDGNVNGITIESTNLYKVAN